MRKKIVMVILFLAFFYAGFSQKNTGEIPLNQLKNSIGLTIGYNQSFLKDLNFSPLNYNGKGVIFSMTYTYQKPNGKGIFNIDLDYNASTLMTDANSFFDSSSIAINSEISYVTQVLVTNNFNLYLGGRYNSYAQSIDADEVESSTYLQRMG